MVITIIPHAGLFCLQVRRHHVTPICDYEKTSMRNGGWGGGSYMYIFTPIFWLFISQVEKVQGNYDMLSQGLEHSEVSCYLFLKLLIVSLIEV